MKKPVLIFSIMLAVVISLQAQWYTESCGVQDFANCSQEEFNCMWNTATRNVGIGTIRIITGVAAGATAVVLPLYAMSGDIPIEGLGLLIIESGCILWTFFGLLTGASKCGTGGKQKTELRKHPLYKDPSYQSFRISPDIQLHSVKDITTFGVRATLQF